MERIKQFFSDEAGSGELTSSVLLIGAVVIIAGAALGLLYTNINNFYTDVATWVGAADVPPTFPIQPAP